LSLLAILAYGFEKVEPTHILLVEDCAGDTLLLLQAMAFCPIPLKLHVARDGEQGLYMLATADFKPSLIILDLNMPRISGYTFLERYEPKEIPVVVFSGSSSDADKRFALELGASEYVQKPIEFEAFTDVFCQIVVNWLGQKETSAAVP
jgi:chemotaxis family two-component system response regulator Rcp1